VTSRLQYYDTIEMFKPVRRQREKGEGRQLTTPTVVAHGSRQTSSPTYYTYFKQLQINSSKMQMRTEKIKFTKLRYNIVL
jgi:hypothetical protein